MEEYIVTLWRHEDLADFYDDMETEGGSLYIPDRSCNCCQRRPISRNTKYDLTEEESDLIRQDERVRAITKVSDIPDRVPLSFTRSGTYDKNWDSDPLSTSRNWCLWRSRNAYNDNSATIDAWFPDGPMLNSPENPNLNSSVTYTETGKNVDVVIIDGALDPNHPEAAVNDDGTGGSRVVELDWNIYTAEVGGSLVGAYPYVYSSGTVNNQVQHGAACATQVGGNRQGHAPGCNLYNIWPYQGSAIGLPGSFSAELFDYIRAFHRNKPVNPETGCKNPTICNASIGYSYTLTESGPRWPHFARNGSNTYGVNVASSTYRLTNQEMEDAEICAQSEITGTTPNRSATITGGRGVAFIDSNISDIEDMLADGIHWFAAAGNDNSLCKYTTDTGHDNIYLRNRVAYSTQVNGENRLYHHSRSFTPNTAGVLVGAISGTPQSVLQSSGKGEMPIYYSNRGTGVDIYAFCDFSTSGANDASGQSYITTDPRNSNYFIRFFNGTSSACPQTVGIATLILERFPDMTPADLKEYLLSRARDRDNDNEIGDDGRGWPGEQPTNFDPFEVGSDGDFDNYSFEAGETPKVAMNLTDIRRTSGNINRNNLHNRRRTSGAVYPRQRTARTYRTRV
ncbi:S8 family peptidase [bacterium]|nr:S8 family peptidase [bacterium]